MATPLGIRIDCNSFLLQDFPFNKKFLGFLGLRLLAPITVCSHYGMYELEKCAVCIITFKCNVFKLFF